MFSDNLASERTFQKELQRRVPSEWVCWGVCRFQSQLQSQLVSRLPDVGVEAVVYLKTQHIRLVCDVLGI